MQFAVNIIFISHPPLYTWADCYAVGQGGQGWSMSTSQFCRVQSVVPGIEIRDAGSTRGARSRGTSWQTSAGTIDVATIIYDIYI